MKYVKYIIIILIIITLLFISYSFYIKNKKIKIEEFQSIQYRAYGGFMSYFDTFLLPNIIINKNYEVILKPSNDLIKYDDYIFTITKQELEEIINSLNKNNFFLQNSHIVKNCYDAGTIKLEVRTNRLNKEVELYCYNNKNIDNIIKIIYNIIDKDKKVSNYYNSLMKKAKEDTDINKGVYNE